VVVRLLSFVVLLGCSPGVGPDNDLQPTPDASNMQGMSATTGLERFIGRAATSPTVPFGGSPYCNYSMTLRDIVVEVLADPIDGLVAMVVRDTTSEAIVGTCPYAAAAPNRQVFEHVGGTQLWPSSNMIVPDMQGNTSNSPRTAATSSLVREKDTRLTATLTWRRTDQPAPLDWTVMMPAPMILDRVLCEMGHIYCIGGALSGTEYGCVDGLRMVERKQCANGCAEPSAALPHADEYCK
jgi:hypothetical protein